MITANSLAKQLKNIGPAMAARMLEAGIDTPEKLKQLGAKKAFELMYPSGDHYGDYNAAYLYALEGAIRNCDWSEVPDTVKREYKVFAQTLQELKQTAK